MKRRWIKYVVKSLKWIGLCFLLISIMQVVIYKFVPVKYPANIIWYNCNQLLHAKKPVFHHRWIPKEEMSDYFSKAAIAAEDKFYYSHHGFDFFQIMVAIAESSEKPRGASTISQQTAKNVFLWHHRSYFRKIIEAYYTLLIELIWGKDRIMEVYLNTVQTGENIFGMESVANIRFHKPAKDIDKSETALIIATLPNPIIYNSAAPSEYVLERQALIMQWMETYNGWHLK